MLLRAWPWHLDVQVMSTSQSSKETCRACTAGRRLGVEESFEDDSMSAARCARKFLRHRSKKLVLTRDAWRQAWPLHGMQALCLPQLRQVL